MASRLRQAAVVLALILGSIFVTTTSAALALRLPAFERLNTETGSHLEADYSADPRGLRLPPLSVDLIQAAASDETALDAAPEGAPVRVPVAGAPTVASPPASLPGAPTRTAVPTQTAAPAEKTRPAATATLRPPDAATATPPIPTATSTATWTSSPTGTMTPTSTATRTSTPTSSPTVATATSTAAPATPTPAAATQTAEPPATETAVPVTTDTPAPAATETPVARATDTPPARATDTATARATDTVTPRATDTATAPAAATLIATASPTKTASRTPTNTATKTPTATPTPILGKIYVDPLEQTVPPGAVSVDIVVQDAVNLGGYLVTVTWDDNILGLVAVSNGAFLGSTGRTVVCAAPTLAAGSVTFSCNSVGLVAGPDGTGVLATLHFVTLADGTSPVDIVDAKLSTTDLALYDITATDGSVTVATPTPTSTPTPLPTNTSTATPTPTATSTPTATPTATPTPTPIPNSATFTCSANAPVTVSSGNNDGFEISPQKACADDGAAAQDVNTGTSTNPSCSDPGKDRHIFSGFGVSLPGGATLDGIEVRLDAASSAPASLCVELSWNAGAGWTPAQTTGTLTASQAEYLLDIPIIGSGHNWNASDLSDTTLRVRITSVAASAGTTIDLDYVQIRTTYTP
jgi:hypothetical protein